MMKLIAVAATLAFFAGPALAQTNNGTMPVPSAQNSGAGIAGQPGNKNGPPAKQQTTGASSSTSSAENPTRQEDSAKIPGKAGGKSGPTVKPPRE